MSDTDQPKNQEPKKRRPTARDRDIVDAILSFPDGWHSLLVEPDIRAPLKSEGSVHFLAGSRRFSLHLGK